MAKKKEIFYGRQPALELLKSDRAVDKIMLQKGLVAPELSEIMALCKERDIPMQFVPKEKIDYLLYPLFQGKYVNHQGVIGFFGTISYFQLDDILNQVLTNGEHAMFLVLDGITDVRNIGAIARTALCMGVHAIVIPQKGSASITADAIKASAGALNKLPVCRERDLNQAIQFLQLNGIAVIGSSLRASKSLKEVDLNRPVALVLGSEGSGMSREVSNLCDEQFIIPMKDELDSLNVSVSCGMMLYEAFQQRIELDA